MLEMGGLQQWLPVSRWYRQHSAKMVVAPVVAIFWRGGMRKGGHARAVGAAVEVCSSSCRVPV
jgi:hypothetical protein